MIDVWERNWSLKNYNLKIKKKMQDPEKSSYKSYL